MVLRPGQKRALDPSARIVAASVLEDDNLTRLILGSIGGPWEWCPWDSASCEAAKALLYATATNKRWHRLAGLNDVWKQIVVARWPAAAAVSVQSFKQFYRSHHLALREGDLEPTAGLTYPRGPALPARWQATAVSCASAVWRARREMLKNR